MITIAVDFDGTIADHRYPDTPTFTSTTITSFVRSRKIPAWVTSPTSTGKSSGLRSWR